MKKTILIITTLFLLIQTAYADDNFKPLTNHDFEMINKGFMQYLSNDFTGRYADGYYTDPNTETQVYDFWSNGKWSKFDRDNNGHHETILEINGRQISYVGTIGGNAQFIDVAYSYNEFLNRPFGEWVKTTESN